MSNKPDDRMDDSGAVPWKKAKPEGGCRCVVGGCNNTNYDGFSIHELPKQKGPVRKGWINFIKLKLSGFNAAERVRVHVCSGHFDRTQYDETQVMMYQMNIRKLPPRLKPSAIPHIHKAIQPFPPDFFAQGTANTTMPSVTVATTTATTTATTSSITTMSNMLSSASSSFSMLGPVPTVTKSQVTIPVPSKSLPKGKISADASTSATWTDTPKLSGKNLLKRRLSVYSRRKDVKTITEEYEQKQIEEEAQEQLRKEKENTKAVQCTPVMVNKTTQKRTRTRTCGLTVKPLGKAKRIQTLQSRHEDETQITKQDAGTQTILQNKKVDQEEGDEMDEEAEVHEDDTRKDPDYNPDTEELHEDVEEHMNRTPDILHQTKYIVFEEQLLELFKQCRSCHMPCTVTKVQPPNFGSQLKIVASCEECDFTTSWYSQPKVGDLYAGNIMLSAAVLFAGASPTKVLKVFRHMKLKGISYSTFMEHQGTYLQPAVIQVYSRQQQALFNQFTTSGQGLTLGGDGRSDSPGHSAKYGSYTLMDLTSNKVIEVELVQVTEVANSNAMELEGLRRGLTKLGAANVPIRNIITDRHLQIAKYLREFHPDINHYYDVWHIAKGVKKKIKALAKVKSCELAGEWQRSLVNHIYWTANSTTDGDGEVMKAKYRASLNHIRNIHKGHGTKYPNCTHAEEYPDREWMKAGSKVYEKLSDIMLRPRLLSDVGKMSPFGQTSKVEAFHNVLLHWCPKLVAYSYQGMKCRLYVAVLHWNENGDRQQATNAEGNPIYTIKYPRSKEGGHTVEKVLSPATYDYVTSLMQEVLDLVATRRKISSELQELQPQPARCATYEHPDKTGAILAYEQHHRFAPAE